MKTTPSKYGSIFCNFIWCFRHNQCTNARWTIQPHLISTIQLQSPLPMKWEESRSLFLDRKIEDSTMATNIGITSNYVKDRQNWSAVQWHPWIGFTWNWTWIKLKTMLILIKIIWTLKILHTATFLHLTFLHLRKTNYKWLGFDNKFVMFEFNFTFPVRNFYNYFIPKWNSSCSWDLSIGQMFGLCLFRS